MGGQQKDSRGTITVFFVPRGLAKLQQPCKCCSVASVLSLLLLPACVAASTLTHSLTHSLTSPSCVVAQTRQVAVRAPNELRHVLGCHDLGDHARASLVTHVHQQPKLQLLVLGVFEVGIGVGVGAEVVSWPHHRGGGHELRHAQLAPEARLLALEVGEEHKTTAAIIDNVVVVVVVVNGAVGADLGATATPGSSSATSSRLRHPPAHAVRNAREDVRRAGRHAADEPAARACGYHEEWVVHRTARDELTQALGRQTRRGGKRSAGPIAADGGVLGKSLLLLLVTVSLAVGVAAERVSASSALVTASDLARPTLGMCGSAWRRKLCWGSFGWLSKQLHALNEKEKPRTN
jgi:hypothetical protein